jgi:hypothetical protein
VYVRKMYTYRTAGGNFTHDEPVWYHWCLSAHWQFLRAEMLRSSANMQVKEAKKYAKLEIRLENKFTWYTIL